MHASTFLLILSLRCLVLQAPYRSKLPSSACTECTSCTQTATAEFSCLASIPLSYFLTPPRIHFKPKKLFPCLLLLLLCGDISVNPGPSFLPKKFLLHSLNIRSFLNENNSISLNDLVSCSRPPALVSLQETWISDSSTNAHILDCIPPGYSFHSYPRMATSAKPKKSNKTTKQQNETPSGGGTAFLVRQSSVHVLNSSVHTFKSFECCSITLRLASDLLTVYNVYRPPSTSDYSPKSTSVILDDLGSLLSLAATTPHEFLVTGDFNIHVDNPSDSLASKFLKLLSSLNLIQHVNFPTHKKNHTLDLVITSSDSLFSPEISHSPLYITDHYLIIADLEIKPLPKPPPSTHSFRRIGSIDRQAFITDILNSQLVLNPPSSLDDLLSCYNSTLSDLLNIHAQLVNKLSQHPSNPWFTSYLQAFKTFRRRLEHLYKRATDPTARTKALLALKSATNRYHKLVASAKKKYYSSLIHSNSSNPRHLWKAVNSLLHRKSSSPLPTSIPSQSIADTFCSFFSDKISSLRFTLQSLLDSQTPTMDPLPSHNPIPPASQSSLTILSPASESEVSLLLNALPNKQCELDPIPTSLLKDCASALVPIITKIINLSLFTGNFPLNFKHSHVTPLLKKSNLDKENVSNYRPISNLSFLSKLTERIVLARLNDYLSSNSLLNPHQSGFTKHHSTETLLVSLYNKLVSAVSHQQVSCLCLLDISAAFDTIDHTLLLHRLSSWFGLSGTALNWFQSYLSSRSFSGKASGHCSQPLPLSCGVPQGSVLGPLLFILYTTPLSHLIKSFSVDHHLYADDTQLYISFLPSSFSTSITQLLSVVNLISKWMSSNLLCLNPSKTEFIILGLPDKIKKIPDPTIHLSTDSSSLDFVTDSSVRNLGVTFDPHLSFSNHISNLSRTCFLHIRDLRRIRPMLDFKTASTIATSIVHSKLDYCNSLFLNLERTQLNRLQLIQNSLARAVTRTPRHHHITPILKSLHWLKIPQRIHFKVLSLTYNSLQYSQPKYLRDLFIIQPTRSTRSSSYLTLSLPPVTSRLKFSNRAISYTAPRLWNALPSELRKFLVPAPSSSTIHPSPPLITHHHLPQTPLSISPHSFHSKLKSYLFKNSYPDSDPPLSNSRPKRPPP